MTVVPSRPVGVAASTPRPLSPNRENRNDPRLTIARRPEQVSHGRGRRRPQSLLEQRRGRGSEPARGCAFRRRTAVRYPTVPAGIELVPLAKLVAEFETTPSAQGRLFTRVVGAWPMSA